MTADPQSPTEGDTMVCSFTAGSAARSAALVLVLGCLALTGCARHPGPGAADPTTQPAAADRASAATSPASPAIPWDAVSTGWSVVTIARADSKAAGRSKVSDLVLVSPDGARYPAGEVSATAELVDVSADGRRAVLVTAGDAHSTVSVYDLPRAMVVSAFTVPGLVDTARFTRPTGAQLIVSHGTPGDGLTVERRALDGTIKVRFAAPGPDVGLDGVLTSPDGLFVVVNQDSSFAVLDNASGHLVRTLATPSSSPQCRAMSWWDDTTLVIGCSDAAHGERPAQVFLMPVDGSHVRQLTHATDGFGWVDAWPTAYGTVLLGASGCGPGPIATMSSGGQGHRLAMRFPGVEAHAVPSLVDVAGDRVLVVVAAECGGPATPSLASWDLATTTGRILVGPGAGGPVEQVAVIRS